MQTLESVANILHNLTLFTKHTDIILKDFLNQELIHLYCRIFKIPGKTFTFDVGNSYYVWYFIFYFRAENNTNAEPSVTSKNEEKMNELQENINVENTINTNSLINTQ